MTRTMFDFLEVQGRKLRQASYDLGLLDSIRADPDPHVEEQMGLVADGVRSRDEENEYYGEAGTYDHLDEEER